MRGEMSCEEQARSGPPSTSGNDENLEKDYKVLIV
jgi:hypothetical protein